MNSRLHAACWLAFKDLRSYFRDRSALVLGFLVPISLVTVFGWLMTYAFGGGSGMPKVQIWVVDEDRSPLSEKLVEKLRKSAMLSVFPKEDGKQIHAEQLRSKIADGDAHHGIVIPTGFERSLLEGRIEKLKLIRDPGRQMEGQVIQFALAQNLVQLADGKLVLDVTKSAFERQGMSAEALGNLEKSLKESSNTIREFLEDRDAGFEGPLNAVDATKNSIDKSSMEQDGAVSDAKDFDAKDGVELLKNLLPLSHEDVAPPSRPKMVGYQQAQSVCGMSVMMLLFGVTNAGAILLAEREQGTLKRLLTLPIARESILLGKFLFVFVTGMLQMFVVLVYGEWMFRVGMWRDPVSLLLIVTVWVSTASAFGVLIATVCRSTKQSEGLTTILVLGMSALGGCWFPVQTMDMPPAMSFLAHSTLTYWAMESFQGLLWNNLPWYSSKIGTALAVQLLWTSVMGIASCYFFRKNYLGK